MAISFDASQSSFGVGSSTGYGSDASTPAPSGSIGLNAFA